MDIHISNQTENHVGATLHELSQTAETRTEYLHGALALFQDHASEPMRYGRDVEAFLRNAGPWNLAALTTPDAELFQLERLTYSDDIAQLSKDTRQRVDGNRIEILCETVTTNTLAEVCAIELEIMRNVRKEEVIYESSAADYTRKETQQLITPDAPVKFRSEQRTLAEQKSPTRFRTWFSHTAPWEKPKRARPTEKQLGPAYPFDLSPREFQVVNRLFLTNKEIAAELKIGENEVRNYIGRAAKKLCATDNHELLVRCMEEKLVPKNKIPDFDPNTLDAREQEVVIKCWNKTTKETQEHLGLGRTSVRQAIARAYKKTGVVERRQLNLVLIKAGVVPPAP